MNPRKIARLPEYLQNLYHNSSVVYALARQSLDTPYVKDIVGRETAQGKTWIARKFTELVLKDTAMKELHPEGTSLLLLFYKWAGGPFTVTPNDDAVYGPLGADLIWALTKSWDLCVLGVMRLMKKLGWEDPVKVFYSFLDDYEKRIDSVRIDLLAVLTKKYQKKMSRLQELSFMYEEALNG